MTHGSILPPLINTFEVYSLIRMENFTADSQDVSYMKEVKKHYNLTRINWNGDLCSPREYSWEGLTCDYSKSNQNPRIVGVNLSTSGLKGGLTIAFMNMVSLENLDLSHNNLTGGIPDYQIKSIKVLLVGVTFCGVPHFSSTKPQQPHCRDTEDYAMYEEETPLHIDIRRFTYAELKHITNDFNSIVGKGGFGTVYHGTMENADEVVVKVLMETSIAESTDFLPEVQTLSKVHHKNLVTLQGYCQNKCLALIYDFMPRGNLQQLLREGEDYSLNWEQRLHIALDSAQGLEYLHESCTPSIVHRDVKTANILLDKNLVGIIADFGLSRAFNDAHTHISTVAAGTLGYLDPEYHATFQLTTKTDVYSFGIVLLEIITGKPPVLMDPQTYHLPNWVRQKIAKGSIQDIVDKKLLDQYDTSSLQSVVDLAMNCVESAAMDRPTMTEVVSRLKVLLPTVPSEKQYASASSRCTNSMDAEMRRQFQLLISEERNEESSFRSGYTGGMPELNPLSGR
ncbi:senescence-induced receptor-like serine/threonine-protein kinase [Triticum aestivum]|uniref:senescence-induced receptor-like serine/threonine-protein kinase n=1 Tax=Triticum aestivum TaxID=4565 RepID=UPI001D02656C|nr:senescence-induced receptor-like serine/threonine-protein kinase [Triticum aestivum]